MNQRWMVVLLTFGPIGTMWSFVQDGDGTVKTFASKRQAEEYRKTRKTLSSEMSSVRVSIKIESPVPNKVKRHAVSR